MPRRLTARNTGIFATERRLRSRQRLRGGICGRGRARGVMAGERAAIPDWHRTGNRLAPLLALWLGLPDTLRQRFVFLLLRV